MKNHHTIMPNCFIHNTRLPVFALAVLVAHSVFGAYDPDFSKQWHLSNTGQVINGSAGVAGIDIDWIEAMKIYKPKGKTVMAIVDTGVSFGHSEFYDKVNNVTLSPLWFNVNEVLSDDILNGVDDDNNGYIDDIIGWSYGADNSLNAIFDSDGHGTAVASTISVNKNNKGLEPLAPDAQIMAVKIQEESGPLNSDRISASINYARLNGAKIINLSLGGSEFKQENLNLMKQLAGQNILVVAAAGNGGNDQIGDNNDITPHYPSSYESSNIISVASINNKGALSGFSNYGLQGVDIAAPGESIYTANSLNEIAEVYVWGNEYGNARLADWTTGFLSGDDNGIYWSPGWYNNQWYVLGDSVNEKYSDSTHSYILSKEIDLRNFTQSVLGCGLWVSLSSGDYAHIEIYDGSDYKILKTYYPETQIYDTPIIDISEYDGKIVRIRYRLYTNSDWYFNSYGVDMEYTKIYAYSSLSTFDYISGTSFAAPVVSGVAALVWSHRPYLSAIEVKNIILDSAYKLPSLAGKVKSGGMVDAYEALAQADEFHESKMKEFFRPVTSYSGDWAHSNSWSFFYTGSFPWVFHTYHGWLFSTNTGNEVSWLYDLKMGWLYTTGSIYPYIYSVSHGKWVFYDNGTTAPRKFYTFDGSEPILVE